ncbi:ornithine cyclodeaminase [Kutzneria buriramensis]|uniref:Ornithine cyclodeaminase n=1 Tax=Kutzneria buriramensis TaxID=1045776 RepID=A0A3E0I0I5_9PSEU|nr:ornithine cyclodeaminase [Kutzneria buriramensis]
MKALSGSRRLEYVKVISDGDVRATLRAGAAVRVSRDALVDAYRGTLKAPPRTGIDVGSTELVFTAGGNASGTAGFRCYGLWPGHADQLVAVWDNKGNLRGVVIGTALGALRTGGLGGAAVDVLAKPDASVCAVIGSGTQSWAQLWAACAVRTFSEVRVSSPTPENRAKFAARARDELGLNAVDLADSVAAVRDADVVLVATKSAKPVLPATAFAPGCHVNTIGPKLRGASELPPELASVAAIVATDSPAQAAAYGNPFFTGRKLAHLGGIIAGDLPGRISEGQITLYCATGLAGAEVLLADHVISELALAG